MVQTSKETAIYILPLDVQYEQEKHLIKMFDVFYHYCETIYNQIKYQDTQKELDFYDYVKDKVDSYLEKNPQHLELIPESCFKSEIYFMIAAAKAKRNYPNNPYVKYITYNFRSIQYNPKEMLLQLEKFPFPINLSDSFREKYKQNDVRECVLSWSDKEGLKARIRVKTKKQ